MSEHHDTFSVNLELVDNYRFLIDFGDFGEIYSDEPAPLGSGDGPNPARLLASAVANCLAASLMFAIRKFKGDPGKVNASVTGHVGRVEGRLRIEKMAVTIQLDNDLDELPHLDKVLGQFENFCMVTESVRSGIDVDVSVLDQYGNPVVHAE